MTYDTINMPISSIRLNGGTQPRVRNDEPTIKRYAEDMQRGDEFPPVIVYFDDTKGEYWLADGFHRVLAALKCERISIAAEVRPGTQRDAILHSKGANHDHGLPRSNEDKRALIKSMLLDETWVQWNDSDIARACKVDPGTVKKVRDDMVASSEIPKMDTRTVQRGDKTYEMNTKQIGKNSYLLGAHQWFKDYHSHKDNNPDILRFMRMGDNHEYWIALGEDAKLVARLLGVETHSAELPHRPRATMFEKFVKLHVPGDLPLWYWSLHAALDGKIIDVEVDDPLLWKTLEQVQTVEPKAKHDPAPAPVDAAPPDGMILSMTGDSYIKPYIPEPKPEATPFYASSSSNGGTDKWFTPADLMERVRRVLGPVALDPASCEEANAVVQATRYFTEDSDGLKQKWVAPNIYLNPPFGSVEKFIPKMYEEFCDGNFEKGILLLPARTDTQWFKLLREFPQCYLHGRVKFWGEADKGNTAPFPSVVIGVGVDAAALYAAFGDIGDVVVPHIPAAASKPVPQPSNAMLPGLPGLLAITTDSFDTLTSIWQSALDSEEWSDEERAIIAYMEPQIRIGLLVAKGKIETLRGRDAKLAALAERLASATTHQERASISTEANALKVGSITVDDKVIRFLGTIIPQDKQSVRAEMKRQAHDDFEEAA